MEIHAPGVFDSFLKESTENEARRGAEASRAKGRKEETMENGKKYRRRGARGKRRWTKGYGLAFGAISSHVTRIEASTRIFFWPDVRIRRPIKRRKTGSDQCPMLCGFRICLYPGEQARFPFSRRGIFPINFNGTIPILNHRLCQEFRLFLSPAEIPGTFLPLPVVPHPLTRPRQSKRAPGILSPARTPRVSVISLANYGNFSARVGLLLDKPTPSPSRRGSS